MGKFGNMLIILIIVQAVLIIFHGQDCVTYTSTNFTLGTEGVNITESGGNVTTTCGSVWEIVTNPDRWNSLTFIATFVLVAGALGAIGAIAGTYFGFTTDFIVFAPLVASLAAMGVVLTNLYTTLFGPLVSMFGCSSLTGQCAQTVRYILIPLVGIPAFIYFWTLIEWWRGKEG